ncbi:hypothetical protein BC937DRAFT_92048, partial [Endogone sp. FLAS-F59071]
ARLIPIQITIAKNHSKSMDKFFNNWEMWTKKLTDHKIEIETTFLWITEDKRMRDKVPKKKRYTRQGEKLINPEYTEVFITVKDVNNEIGMALESARSE